MKKHIFLLVYVLGVVSSLSFCMEYDSSSDDEMSEFDEKTQEVQIIQKINEIVMHCHTKQLEGVAAHLPEDQAIKLIRPLLLENSKQRALVSEERYRDRLGSYTSNGSVQASLLFELLKKECFQVAAILIEKGIIDADARFYSDGGIQESVFYWALRPELRSSDLMIEFLLDHGFDPSAKDENGDSLYDVVYDKSIKEKIKNYKPKKTEKFTKYSVVPSGRRYSDKKETHLLVSFLQAAAPQKSDFDESTPDSFSLGNNPRGISNGLHGAERNDVSRVSSWLRPTKSKLIYAVTGVLIYMGYHWYSQDAINSVSVDFFTHISDALVHKRYKDAYQFTQENLKEVQGFSDADKAFLQDLISQEENNVAQSVAENAASLNPFQRYFACNASVSLHYLAGLSAILSNSTVS